MELSVNQHLLEYVITYDAKLRIRKWSYRIDTLGLYSNPDIYIRKRRFY